MEVLGHLLLSNYKSSLKSNVILDRKGKSLIDTLGKSDV